MAFYTFRVGSYSRCIYLDGTRTFEQAIAEDIKYEQAIKVYASTYFDYYQIDLALTNGYINQQQYDDTIALKTVITPRPLMVTVPTT